MNSWKLTPRFVSRNSCERTGSAPHSWRQHGGSNRRASTLARHGLIVCGSMCRMVALRCRLNLGLCFVPFEKRP